MLCGEKDTLLFYNQNDHIYHKYWKFLYLGTLEQNSDTMFVIRLDDAAIVISTSAFDAISHR